ncbi:dTDP-4-dehydrorhamnose reductase [Oceanobacillus sp. 1P07AA]|uniref:dTDP-4-dehydrorhamnose reductase n=1 Tax=Oceanobacillus sp. 1P07AA TaxID=3132293 RepID=UPI0039A4C8D8
MRILITGGEGQLGKAFASKLALEVNLKCLSKQDMDITNPVEIDHHIKSFQPDYVIHTAAYTAVDNSEKFPFLALQVNTIGTLHLARTCKKYGAKLVFFSSDYVFDGEKNTPYSESDLPNPINNYGLSKWLAEEFILQSIPENYIIRTSWLYGDGGNNFVNTMKNNAYKKKPLKVVNDQVGSPTYTSDLVEACIPLLELPFGIYHIRNQGMCSWYSFAQTIYEELGTDPNLITPVSSKDYKTPATRPSYSVLGMDKLKASGTKLPRFWKEALRNFINKE